MCGIPAVGTQARRTQESEADVMVARDVRPDQNSASVFERWTGIPAGRMLEGERTRLCDGNQFAQTVSLAKTKRQGRVERVRRAKVLRRSDEHVPWQLPVSWPTGVVKPNVEPKL